MTRRKQLIFAATTVALSLTTILALIEIALRFLPVVSGLYVLPVTEHDPIMHFQPNSSFVFSEDWDLHLVNRGHINNDGWVNDQDYVKDGPPLLAVVGASMIAALMVPYAQTLQGRLAQALDGKMRVYSFGVPGGPLSQYLMWAQYAVRKFGAEALIISVVSSNFDQSLLANRVYDGFWLYEPGSDGQLNLRLIEYHPGPKQWFDKHSALARYLSINLFLPQLIKTTVMTNWHRLRALFTGEQAVDDSYEVNGPADANISRLNESLAVTDAFFRDLPKLTGLPPDRIAFILDGFRYPDVAAKGAGSYFDRMRGEFRKKAEAKGYEVIDMDPFFFAHFRQYHEKFEDSRDFHWNALGHSIAADAVMSSKLPSRFLVQSR